MKKTLAPTRSILCKKTYKQSTQEKKIASKHPVKTLEIFISNLDWHIADSYKKLRNQKQKTTSLNSTVKKKHNSVQSSIKKQTNQRDLPYFEESLGTTQKKNLYQSSSSLTYNTLESTQNPTLISNEQVTKYINFVYETYNIPDPLSNSKRQNIIKMFKHGERKSSLTTISLRKKSSLSSFKQKIVMQKNIDLTPMKTYEVQNNLSHLNTTNNSVHQEFDNIKLSNSLLSAGKSSSRKFQTNKKDISKRITENDIQNEGQIKEVFRYCFACQEHILQKNLKFHEQVCKPLQEAYLKTYPQLLIMLNEKITRITTQVQTGIVQVQPEKMMSQFTNIKQAVVDWMGQISRLENKYNSKGINTNQIKSKYNSIQNQLSKNLNSHLTSISRLNWFIRLRQNLLHKMNGQF